MSKIERAKAAGWRIECLGDQQDGLWNWAIWSPDNGYVIQTEYPLANEGEAWDYFYGFIVGLPADELAPAQPATADAGAIERETDAHMQHHDKRVGQSDDYAKGYDAGLLDGYAGVDADWVARFEARQAELRAENARLQLWVQGQRKELDDLQAKLAAAEARADAAVEALRPFADPWLEWMKPENEWARETMDIVEFFNDYLDNDVLVERLEAAANALASAHGKGE